MSTENPSRPNIEALEAALALVEARLVEIGPLLDNYIPQEGHAFIGSREGKFSIAAKKKLNNAIVALHNTAPALFAHIRGLEDNAVFLEQRLDQVSAENAALETRLAQPLPEDVAKLVDALISGDIGETVLVGTADALTALARRNAELERVLRFYADPENYKSNAETFSPPQIYNDAGATARRIVQGDK